ncbi:ferredoxin [Patescibacteria group bacterium]|nr:ferredoxin [Patescibacteria group bacterium]MBU4142872.1 ferredoxin [Patescibacteria group bacterium]
MKIIQEQKKCIGCGSCVAVCDKYFEMADNSLAVIKGGQINGENMELEIQEAGCAQEASEICPVQIIKVEN